MMKGTWGGNLEARACVGTARSVPRRRGRMEAKRAGRPLRCADGISQVPRHGQVPHFLGARVGGQLRPGAGAAAARARRAGDREDAARRGHRVRLGLAPDPLAREVHHAGAGRALRLRHGPAPVRLAIRRRRRQGHPALHQARAARAGVRLARPGRAPHRRDRQGRSGVPQRPLARAGPDAVRRHRDGRRGDRARASRDGDHLERGEGAAGRISAPLRLPLHRVPREGLDGAHRPRPPSRPGPEAARSDPAGVLFVARRRRAAETAFDQRADRLDSGPAPRRDRQRRVGGGDAVPRRPAQARARPARLRRGGFARTAAEGLSMFVPFLYEQRERHDRGNRWVGTAGTSPHGSGGIHPTGIKVGESPGGRGALEVAAERRFRDFRSDVTLDTRQIEVVLRRLRAFVREGALDELDVEATIDKTARNGGELEITMRPPRRSNLRVLLLLDVGGSMDPHAHVCERLFSAASRATHFKELRTYYFHNCIYGRVYESAALMRGIPVLRLLQDCDPSWRLIVVGDALMSPWELQSSGSRWSFDEDSGAPGIAWLAHLAQHFLHSAWLNPEPAVSWYGTAEFIRRVFPMYRLTQDGLLEAVHHLMRGGGRH